MWYLDTRRHASKETSASWLLPPKKIIPTIKSDIARNRPFLVSLPPFRGILFVSFACPTRLCCFDSFFEKNTWVGPGLEGYKAPVPSVLLFLPPPLACPSKDVARLGQPTQQSGWWGTRAHGLQRKTFFSQIHSIGPGFAAFSLPSESPSHLFPRPFPTAGGPVLLAQYGIVTLATKTATTRLAWVPAKSEAAITRPAQAEESF